MPCNPRVVGQFGVTLCGVVMCSVTLCIGAPTSVAAQSSAPTSNPYARYTLPGRCVQAAGRLLQRYWRDKHQDTATYHVVADSVPASVVAEARTCATRFNVTTVPVRDLPDLVDLYYWTQQDSLADVAAARLLQAPAAVLGTQAGWTSRAWRLRLLVLGAVSAHPARLATAEKYLRQLDSLRDPSSAPWQMQAHQALALRLLNNGEVAKGRDAIAAALRAGLAMARSEQIDRVYELVQVYSILAEPTSVLIDGPAAVAVFDSARARLLPLRAPGTGGAFDPRLASASMDLMQRVFGGGEESSPRAPNTDQLQLQAFLTSQQAPYNLVSHPAPPVTATRWYPVASDTAARPRPGVVTLVVRADANCGGFCYSRYAVLRRLDSVFAARGLQIVLLASTQGFFHDHPIPEPTQEADSARKYMFDFLKLPGVLGDEETKFSFRDDGMRLDLLGMTLRDYFKGGDAVVVGRDGVVREVVSLDIFREQMVHDVIAALTSK